MRLALASLLALLVFAGSLGLPLYSHTCSTAGNTFHSLGLESTGCGAHADVQPEKPSCCHRSEVAQQHSCCTVTVERFALSFHFFQCWKSSPVIVPEAAIAPVWYPESDVLIAVSEPVIATHRPPPWQTVQRFLSAVCVWRI